MAHARRRNGSASLVIPLSSPPRSDAPAMEQAEIARRLHLTLNQVQTAQESGLRKLRLLLEARGVTKTLVLTAFDIGVRRPARGNGHDPEDGAIRLLRRLFLDTSALDDGGGEVGS